MAKRILVAITKDSDLDVRNLGSMAALARESGGVIRLAFVGPLPAARRDTLDRVVVTAERELARLTNDALEQLRALASAWEDVPIQRVARFGRVTREVTVEAEAFQADLVVLVTSRTPSIVERVVAWYLEHVALGVHVPFSTLPRPGHAERVADALALAGFH
jgi:nucleotide-binding universal stress UspA family protein